MVGEGHAFDMIRRIKEGREASRLRRERANDKLKHLNRANAPYPLPRDIPKIIKFKATNSLRVSCLFCIFKHSPQKTV